MIITSTASIFSGRASSPNHGSFNHNPNVEGTLSAALNGGSFGGTLLFHCVRAGTVNTIKNRNTGWEYLVWKGNGR
jgi:hypothetical protein